MTELELIIAGGTYFDGTRPASSPTSASRTGAWSPSAVTR
jgi:hypothetical protein